MIAGQHDLIGGKLRLPIRGSENDRRTAPHPPSLSGGSSVSRLRGLSAWHVMEEIARTRTQLLRPLCRVTVSQRWEQRTYV